ncbi:MAG TPA: hypothetical protein VH593_01930 [Ktedonobacteraceae bacterium]
MADILKPSEYGGKAMRNGIQPPLTPAGRLGHIHLKAWERLRLEYQLSMLATGDNGAAVAPAEWTPR